MGTQWISAMMFAVVFGCGYWGLIHRRRTSQDSQSAAGPEATAFAESTLVGQRVALVTDPTQDQHDRYGRTLAYLDKADGWDYSIEAARAGAAHSYVYHDQPAVRYPAIAAAEQEAIAAQRGLWGPPCYGHTESVPR